MKQGKGVRGRDWEERKEGKLQSGKGKLQSGSTIN